MPSVHAIQPSPFDPKLGLDKLESFSDSDDDDVEESAAPAYKGKRKQPSKVEDYFTKQVKAAKSIATACEWVLSQVASSRISKTHSRMFGETHFESTQITLAELEWLTMHSELESVLQITSAAYTAAPKWEPFPRISLSPNDLGKIDAERAAHHTKVAEATVIAAKLLIRKGEDAGPMQQVLDYGYGNAPQMTEKMKRGPNSKKQKLDLSEIRRRAGNLLATSKTPKLSSSDSKCDVLECPELSVGICLQSTCSKSMFCSIHLAHVSHSLQPEIRKQKVLFLTFHYTRTTWITEN